MTYDHALTVYEANLDWADSTRADAADVRAMVKHGAEAVLAVELTSPGHPVTRLANLLPGWHVHQGKGSRAMAGVAVHKRRAIGRAGYGLGLGHIPGIHLGVRWITWQDARLDRRPLRLMAAHLPPPRFHSVWWLYALHIIAGVRLSPHPVIVGGDYNSRLSGREVGRLARLAGLRRYGVGIDGLLYSPALQATPAPTVANTDTRSDHPFTGLTFTWREKRGRR